MTIDLHKNDVQLGSKEGKRVEGGIKSEESDFEQENRRAKVLALHSKGFTQLEIAENLNVDQSTISRDLHQLREESRKYIERRVTKDIPFEYNHHISGLNQITKMLWDISEGRGNHGNNTKDVIAALTLLIQCYNIRLEALVGGPQSDMNAKKHIGNIMHNEKIQNDPMLKSMMDPFNRLS
jgi:hypothetical protein